MPIRENTAKELADDILSVFKPKRDQFDIDLLATIIMKAVERDEDKATRVERIVVMAAEALKTEDVRQTVAEIGGEK